MQTLTTIADLRTARAPLRGEIALIPTMGALHAGHLQLIHHARDIAPHVIVSIFVNPTQFAPHEDFDQYPRPLEDDLTACEKAGVDLVFVPTVTEMYPPNLPDVQVAIPQLAKILEGASRPDFFDGVLRVVVKLFQIIQPTVACFGQKDYQQLRMIEAMVAALNMPLRIEPIETVREDDGLAMSSRNRYLTAAQRKHAIGLYKALCQARELIETANETDPAAVEQAMATVLQMHQLEIDYAVVRHPQTLQPIDCLEPSLTGGIVALIAARLGTVRLIDNMILAPAPGIGSL